MKTEQQIHLAPLVSDEQKTGVVGLYYELLIDEHAAIIFENSSKVSSSTIYLDLNPFEAQSTIPELPAGSKVAVYLDLSKDWKASLRRAHELKVDRIILDQPIDCNYPGVNLGSALFLQQRAVYIGYASTASSQDRGDHSIARESALGALLSGCVQSSQTHGVATRFMSYLSSRMHKYSGLQWAGVFAQLEELESIPENLILCAESWQGLIQPYTEARSVGARTLIYNAPRKAERSLDILHNQVAFRGNSDRLPVRDGFKRFEKLLDPFLKTESNVPNLFIHPIVAPESNHLQSYKRNTDAWRAWVRTLIDHYGCEYVADSFSSILLENNTLIPPFLDRVFGMDYHYRLLAERNEREVIYRLLQMLVPLVLEPLKKQAQVSKAVERYYCWVCAILDLDQQRLESRPFSSPISDSQMFTEIAFARLAVGQKCSQMPELGYLNHHIVERDKGYHGYFFLKSLIENGKFSNTIKSRGFLLKDFNGSSALFELIVAYLDGAEVIEKGLFDVKELIALSDISVSGGLLKILNEQVTLIREDSSGAQ
ncbi:MAG: hypothetical protein ACPGN3_05180 [Opitutales bacterium]